MCAGDVTWCTNMNQTLTSENLSYCITAFCNLLLIFNSPVVLNLIPWAGSGVKWRYSSISSAVPKTAQVASVTSQFVFVSGVILEAPAG